MDYYAIGQRIRKYRKAKGLSQEQLAEIVDISTTHMSHIETGNTKLSLQVFADLAEALQVNVDSLLTDVNEASKQRVYQEIADILDRCTPVQAQALKEIISSTWNAINKYL
mgnify:CR=1 FL=1